MATMRDIAQLIANRIAPPNPIMVGQLIQDLGTNADTPMVTVALGEAERRAVYLPPHAITPECGVFVARMSADLSSPLIVLATNIQVGPWGGGAANTAYGEGEYGTGPYGA
jgi:hypothetical protein